MKFKTKEDVQSYIEQMNEKKEVIEHAIDCAEKCMEGFVTYDELTDIDELEVAPKLWKEGEDVKSSLFFIPLTHK